MTAPSPVRLAVFDCDGTLVDGQGAVVSAMARAFAAHRLPAPDSHAVRRMVGLSLPQAVARLAADADHETVRAVVASYKEAFRKARAAGEIAEPLYEGIAELLAALAGAGWTLGVATGKSDRGLDHCLAGHGIHARFATLQTADRHPSKPHPAMLEAAMAETFAEPDHTVMIGDTVYDIAMAARIGVRAIGVGWGYHEAEELIGAGAQFVAASARELQEYLLNG